jgi:MoxR-like ATPase
MSDHTQNPAPDASAPEILAEVTRAYQSLRTEIHKVIVGQDEVVDQVLMAVFCRTGTRSSSACPA